MGLAYPYLRLSEKVLQLFTFASLFSFGSSEPAFSSNSSSLALPGFGKAKYHDGKYLIGLQKQPADREGNYFRTHNRRMTTDTFEMQGGLYPGYGTHFSYVYVGTPPQRVSVIVDTGSHYTAFPCKGCSGCGSHTDAYFDMSKSSTSHQLSCSECKSASCSGHKCTFSQSYSEGSSWHAFQVQDQFYAGLEVFADTPAENAQHSINFMFGCQSSETGLFKTQLADGIMGMSMSQWSIVDAMHTAGAVQHNNFAMCFKDNGGVLSIGGADTRLHKQTMQFVSLTKHSGWFTVRLKEIRVGSKKLNVAESKFNSGKGVIVDSGTTDTYLNKNAASEFKSKWKSITGKTYGNSAMTFTAAQVSALPAITYVFENQVEVVTKPESYMEKTGNNKYTPRIYLDEWQGCVLGANFMNDHDVFFDEENTRIGFATSDCSMDMIGTNPNQDCEVSEMELVKVCNAVCEPGQIGIAHGTETWSTVVIAEALGQGKPCPHPNNMTETVSCNLNCESDACQGLEEINPWEHCSRTCQQQHVDIVKDTDGKCRYEHSIRSCHVAPCPLAEEATQLTLHLVLSSSQLMGSDEASEKTEKSEAGIEVAGSGSGQGGQDEIAPGDMSLAQYDKLQEEFVLTLSKITGVAPGDMQITKAEELPPSDGARNSSGLSMEVQVLVVPPALLIQEKQNSGKDVDLTTLVTAQQVQLSLEKTSFASEFEQDFYTTTGIPVAVEESELTSIAPPLMSIDTEITDGKESSSSDEMVVIVIVVGSVISGLAVAAMVAYYLYSPSGLPRHRPLVNEDDEEAPGEGADGEDRELEMANHSLQVDQNEAHILDSNERDGIMENNNENGV